MRKIIATLVTGLALVFSTLTLAPAATAAEPVVSTVDCTLSDASVVPVKETPEYKALEADYWNRVSLHYAAESRAWMLTNDLNGVKAQLAHVQANLDAANADLDEAAVKAAAQAWKIKHKNGVIEELRKRLRAATR